MPAARPSARATPARHLSRSPICCSPKATRRRPPPVSKPSSINPKASPSATTMPPRSASPMPSAPAGPREAAANFLLSFIQDHPDSPLLEALFTAPARRPAGNPRPHRSHSRTPGRNGSPPPNSQPPAPSTPGMLGAAAAWPSRHHTPTTCSPSRSSPVRWASTASAPPKPAPKPGVSSPACASKTRTTSSPTAPSSKPPAGRSNEGRIERAFGILDTLRETASSPVMRGEAAFLEARTAAARATRPKPSAFEEAAKSLADERPKPPASTPPSSGSPTSRHHHPGPANRPIRRQRPRRRPRTGTRPLQRRSRHAPRPASRISSPATRITRGSPKRASPPPKPPSPATIPTCPSPAPSSTPWPPPAEIRHRLDPARLALAQTPHRRSLQELHRRHRHRPVDPRTISGRSRRRRSRADPRPQSVPNPQLQRRPPRPRKTRRLRHRPRARPSRLAARRPRRRPRPHQPIPTGSPHPVRQGHRIQRPGRLHRHARKSPAHDRHEPPRRSLRFPPQMVRLAARNRSAPPARRPSVRRGRSTPRAASTRRLAHRGARRL